MIKELLLDKGFIEGTDYSLEGNLLLALEKERQVEQVIYHQAEAATYAEDGTELTPAKEAWEETVLVIEKYKEVLPTLEELKREAVAEKLDAALAVSEYLELHKAARDDDDCLNLDLFLKGGNGWQFKNIPAPSIDELYDKALLAEDKIKQEKAAKEASELNIKEAKEFLNTLEFKGTTTAALKSELTAAFAKLKVLLK